MVMRCFLQHDELSTILSNTGFKLQKISDVAIRIEFGCPIEEQFVCVSRRITQGG